MKATATQEDRVIDPMCGMAVDPKRAAGTSERGGQTYYFCSTACKEKFDAASEEDKAPSQASCCGGDGAGANGRLAATDTESVAVEHEHATGTETVKASTHDGAAHMHHAEV